MTPDELIDLDDDAFADEVTNDLKMTAAYGGPFQDETVIRRTLCALIDHLWFVDSVIRKRRADLDVDVEKLEKTLAFRAHLLGVIDVTDRRIRWLDGPHERNAAAWRELLHEVLDELVDTPEEWILDDFVIPFPVRETGDRLSLRAWRDIRNMKDPSRKLEGVAA